MRRMLSNLRIQFEKEKFQDRNYLKFQQTIGKFQQTIGTAVTLANIFQVWPLRFLKKWNRFQQAPDANG